MKVLITKKEAIEAYREKANLSPETIIEIEGTNDLFNMFGSFGQPTQSICAHGTTPHMACPKCMQITQV